MTKDSDLLLAKIREQQAKDQLERIFNLRDLMLCYALPKYKPDLIDSIDYDRMRRN